MTGQGMEEWLNKNSKRIGYMRDGSYDPNFAGRKAPDGRGKIEKEFKPLVPHD